MNDIIEASEKLIDSIKNNKRYIEYLELKEKLKKDKEINSLINEVKNLQKKIVSLEVKKKDYREEELELNKKIDLLNNYPIYVEFINLQDEINIMLQTVKNTIEKCLYNITN